MIRFIYADQLSQYPVLADSMFRDRAAQFKHRLDWEVTVDENGWEVDQYDRLNPLYIDLGECRRPPWRLGADHADDRPDHDQRAFPPPDRRRPHRQPADLGVHALLPRRRTRRPGRRGGAARRRASSSGCASGSSRRSASSTPGRMPLYRRIGCAPDVIGTGGEGRDRDQRRALAGLESRPAPRSRAKSGIPVSVIARWFDASFPARAVSAPPRRLSRRLTLAPAAPAR